MKQLPNELIEIIYQYDNTYYKKFNNCIKELVQKNKFNKLILELKNLKYKPMFILPKYFKKYTSNYIIFYVK